MKRKIEINNLTILPS